MEITVRTLAFLLLWPAAQAAAAPPALGQIHPDVRCAADSTQGYALYLPSHYREDRVYPVLLAFDPRGRGLNAVERFAPAAEEFGWIIAGSNNSRNGSWEVSAAALAAMSKDLLDHYRIDEKRLYTGGMSGGARVATQVALGTGRIAGVIAASAGWPDGQVHKSAPFPLYGTAGTEDFNWLEMRELDRTLKTPHRLRVFPGGHVWMPNEVAREALEWMELAALRSGLRPADPALVGRLWAARQQQAQSLTGLPAWEAWHAMAEDFRGLHPGAEAAARTAATLEKERSVKDAGKQLRQEIDLEMSARQELATAEAGLADPSQRVASLDTLRQKVGRLAHAAANEKDSPDRRVARRITRSLGMTVQDPQYRKLLDELGLARGPRPQ